MFFAIVTLITALSMAGVAAWFAIAGIMAVFAGAPIPALVMGVVIELGKLVGVSWAYQHWKEKTSIKFTMLPAIIIMMLLTSMGIFGFLSKAHLDQNAPVGNNQARIERIDQRIAREQSRIDDAETVIKQLDETVNTLIEYDKISGPDGARAVKDGQKGQRDDLAAIIDQAEDKIDEYQDDKFELSSELRELELEVGPVKYIAELVYDEPENQLEDAVRLVIIAFIFVFDPMAILLLMAANFSFMRLRKDLPPTNDDPPLQVQSHKLGLKPGEELINLIDAEEDKPKEPQPKSKKTVDRAWMKNIPKNDKQVDNETLFSTIQKLDGRDRTNDEQELLQRFKKLAASRNIPWDVAKRAKVSTRNELLKD
jgi:hypothetical protein